MKTVEYIKLSLMLTYVLSLIAPLRAQNTAPGPIAPAQLNLMPAPAWVQILPGRLPITGSFTVAVKNYADDRLRAGISRMLKRLVGRTVLTSILVADIQVKSHCRLLLERSVHGLIVQTLTLSQTCYSVRLEAGRAMVPSLLA